ncbi:hypothetical protein BH09BAC1_BH09BAC1_00310 [soil metagenome]
MDKALFEEFPPITDEQWRFQVLQDMKGAAPETLEWASHEGITLKPYYRSNNEAKVQVPVRPAEACWIRQDITVSNAFEANIVALDALQHGATALWFNCSAPVNLETLLKGILLEHIQTDWYVADSSTLDGLAAVIKTRAMDAAWVKGSVEFKPTDKVAYFQKYQPLLPDYKLFTIAPSAAETLTEQTAKQLTEANKIVQELTEAGISAKMVLGHIKFDIEIGTDYFFEIARIRSLRALWMVICRQYVPDYASPAFIHATNKKVAPEKDGYYEMIRQTTQALSAAIGGVDSLSLVPHIAAADRTPAFQTRIARNVQLILQHESHLDVITDPAAGSWYLEELTSQLAQKAWEHFVSSTQKA